MIDGRTLLKEEKKTQVGINDVFRKDKIGQDGYVVVSPSLKGV